MEMAPRDLVGAAGVPAIVALVELVKRTFPELPARGLPCLALLFGIGLNLALSGYSGTSPVEAASIGLIAGLAASGLYSQAKVVIER
jgi:hypothetical protein